jgi:hypothetical protein
MFTDRDLPDTQRRGRQDVPLPVEKGANIMNDHPSDAAILDVLEHLIKIHKHDRYKSRGYEVTQALKALAAEIRGRQPESISAALVVLQRGIDNCREFGHEPGHLQNLGEEVIGRWHIIRNALNGSL